MDPPEIIIIDDDDFMSFPIRKSFVRYVLCDPRTAPPNIRQMKPKGRKRHTLVYRELISDPSIFQYKWIRSDSAFVHSLKTNQ